MKRRTHSNDQVAAALVAADGNRVAAARALGCSGHTIHRYMAEEGLIVPKRSLIRWDAAAVLRLREMGSRKPRPSTEAIAEAFGASVGSIQTAMSKFGITRSHAPPAKSGRPPTLTNYSRRKCMCCDRPFMSKGNFNRLCTECKSGNRSVA